MSSFSRSCVIVLAFLFIKGPSLGVDFAGGTMVQLKFNQKTTIPDIRQALESVQLGSSVIQDFGQESLNEYLIRVEKVGMEVGALGEQIKQALTNKFGAEKFEIRRIEFVGPKIGEDLRWRGTLSVIASTIMMGVYIWIRFASAFGARFGLNFGLGAVIALVHDVLVTVGALMLANYEFDLTVIAALLTIVGFSV
ncbi:MAG: protein translocase subunit, partial [Deltaproteobacteria bacterium]|nr:protein translocase subunit [Deltaproteobacteria bacterium]